MEVKPRILLKNDDSHKTLTSGKPGNEWFVATNELRSKPLDRDLRTEIIGVAVTPKNYRPDTSRDRVEFEKNVNDIAVDVRWFSNPIVVSDGGPDYP